MKPEEERDKGKHAALCLCDGQLGGLLGISRGMGIEINRSPNEAG